MKSLRVLTLCVILFGALVCQAHARALLSTESLCTSVDVTVTTTAETALGTLTTRVPSGNTFMVRVRVYFTMTTSANSTTYTVRARRDSVSGTQLGDAIAETVKVTAGGVEMGYTEFTDERSGDFSALTYVSSVQMAGADATTTVSKNCITVDIIQ